jgi:hypothetical protein
MVYLYDKLGKTNLGTLDDVINCFVYGLSALSISGVAPSHTVFPLYSIRILSVARAIVDNW